jgi:hypothetical protein
MLSIQRNYSYYIASIILQRSSLRVGGREKDRNVLEFECYWHSLKTRVNTAWLPCEKACSGAASHYQELLWSLKNITSVK